MGDIERWTMYRRRDWPQVMPWVLPADAPKPEPDEQLEAFEVVRATDYQGAVSVARAEQREATIRHAAEWLRTLGRDDMAVALVRALSVTGGQ